ncbi:MAG TPA: hypothetical protein VME41_11945 [Stellaceae bacterium]|nr:hypothetical protein [Stellaceae bacterium]
MPSAHAQNYPQQPAYGSAPQLETNGPQSELHGDWSARENVVLSHRYDRLLETNLAFRRSRERMECDPITLPTLRERCFASFRQYEPVMVGSSYVPYRYRYHRGAGY